MKYTLILKSQNIYILKNFINSLLYLNNISFINLPKKKKRIITLSSPHVNKKSKEQFEITTYKRLIKIKSENNNFSMELLKKILTKIPSNISYKVKYSK